MTFVNKAFLESGTVKYPGFHESQPAAEGAAALLADKGGHPVYVYERGPGGRLVKMVSPRVLVPDTGRAPFRRPGQNIRRTKHEH